MKAQTTRRAGKKPSAKWMAAQKFEPWTHSDDEWQPPTNEQWNNMVGWLLPQLRMMWLMLYMDKPRLIELVEDLVKDDKTWEPFAHNIRAAGYFLKSASEIFEIAECRFLSAASVVELRASEEAREPQS